MTTLAVILAVVALGVILWLVYETQRSYWECPHCQTQHPSNKVHHCPVDEYSAPEGYGRLNER